MKTECLKKKKTAKGKQKEIGDEKMQLILESIKLYGHKSI